MPIMSRQRKEATAAKEERIERKSRKGGAAADENALRALCCVSSVDRRSVGRRLPEDSNKSMVGC